MTDDTTHGRHVLLERYIEEASIFGGGDVLARYAAVERLKASGLEFTALETFMEHSTFSFRLFLAILDVVRATGAAIENPRQFVIDVFDITYQLGAGWPKQSSHDLHGLLAWTSLCDTDRLLARLRTLPTDQHANLMAALSATTGAEQQKAREALAKYLLQLLGNLVTITVIATGRVIAMSQTVDDQGTAQVRRYKGGSDLDGLALNACETHNTNLCIIKKSGGTIPPDEKVVRVTNGFAAKLVTLTSTRDTTPKDEKRTVHQVLSVAPRVLTGADLRRSWKVSLTDLPEADDDA